MTSREGKEGTELPTIEVYVRRPHGKTFQEAKEIRRISFVIPAGIGQDEVLAHGYAMDGTHAFRTVPRDELVPVEQELITWMAGYGYEVAFK